MSDWTVDRRFRDPNAERKAKVYAENERRNGATVKIVHKRDGTYEVHKEA